MSGTDPDIWILENLFSKSYLWYCLRETISKFGTSRLYHAGKNTRNQPPGGVTKCAMCTRYRVP